MNTLEIYVELQDTEQGDITHMEITNNNYVLGGDDLIGDAFRMHDTNLKARILKAVRSNLPGDTGNFRQNIGNAISMSLGLSSFAFQLAPIFKLFNFMLSFVFAIVVVVDDAVDDVAAVFVAPSLTAAVDVLAFGTCF